MPRNRELMRVFKDVGLVEQLGSGMSRILKVYDKSIFNISEHFIKVEFPFSVPKETMIIANGDNVGDNRGGNAGDNMEIANHILKRMKEEPAVTAAKLAEETKVSTRKISRIVKELRESGRVVRVGATRTGHWEVPEE